MRKKYKSSTHIQSNKDISFNQQKCITTLLEVLSNCGKKVSGKMGDAWKDLQQGIVAIKIQESPRISRKEISRPKNNNRQLNIGIDLNKVRSERKESIQKQADITAIKQNEQLKFRVRTKSQSNNNQLKSIKKTNELIANKRQEEQRKTLRLKEITKRKIELMERLKKIDAELMQVRQEVSPKGGKEDKSLYSSSLNRSFINLANSRLGRQINENSVEQHSKAIEMLQKLNSEKLRRQQRVAEGLKKKQSAQLVKLQELQKKRQQDLQLRRKRNEINSSKVEIKNRQKQIKISNSINSFKLQQFEELPDNESSMIPTTIVPSLNSKKKDIEVMDSIFDHRPSNKNLFTERDMEANEQTHKKIFQKIILQQQKEERGLEKQSPKAEKKQNNVQEVKQIHQEEPTHLKAEGKEQQEVNNTSELYNEIPLAGNKQLLIQKN